MNSIFPSGTTSKRSLERVFFTAALLAASFGSHFGALPVRALTAQQIVQATGVDAGLFAQVGTGNGALSAEIGKAGGFLVHGLALDEASLRQGRAAVLAQNLYGFVSLERLLRPEKLPYADNQVNLLFSDAWSDLGKKGFSLKEAARVLVPQKGVALIGGPGAAAADLQSAAAGIPGASVTTLDGASYIRIVKPLTPGMDEWGHYYYNSEHSASSNDALVRPPSALKWSTDNYGHVNSGNPAAFGSNTEMRLAGGMAYYQESNSSKDPRFRTQKRLIGRDAFNGLPLWKSAPSNKDWWDGRWFNFIAKDDRFYGIEPGDSSQLVAFDARSGRVVQRYASSFKVGGSLGLGTVLCDGIIVQTFQNRMVAFDAASGALKWSYEEAAGNNLAAPMATTKWGGRVYAVVGLPGKVLKGGRWGQINAAAVVAVDLRNGPAGGKPVWRSEAVKNEPVHRLTVVGDFVVAHHGYTMDFVIDSGVGLYASMKASDGSLVSKGNWGFSWQSDSHGMVNWNGKVWLNGRRLHLLDPVGGRQDILPYEWDKTKADRNTPTQAFESERIGQDLFMTGINDRCANVSATGGHLIWGINHYLTRDMKYTYTSLVRPNCGGMTIPAYGMLYATDNGCGCIQGQFRGMTAVYWEKPWARFPDAARLMPGDGNLPVTATQKLAARNPIVDDWGMNTLLKQATPPVADGGLTYIAQVHEHRLEAFNGGAGGSLAWSFTAGGRISQAPIAVGDKLYFGAADGFIYCLDKATGKLAWRFFAGLAEKKVTWMGQLESAWPVPNVVHWQGRIVGVAGRHPEADGGLFVWALNPATGAPLQKQNIRMAHLTLDSSMTPKGSKSFNYGLSGNIIWNDTLKLAGDSLKIKGKAIDFSVGETSTGYLVNGGKRPQAGYLEKLIAASIPDSAYPVTPVAISDKSHKWTMGEVMATLGRLHLGHKVERGRLRFSVTAEGPHTVRLLDPQGREVWRKQGEGGAVYAVEPGLLGRGNYVAVLSGFAAQGEVRKTLTLR